MTEDEEELQRLYESGPDPYPECEHRWEEINHEPPFDVCLSCGGVRR